MTSGAVLRVNGPVVEVELPGLAMADLIEVGRRYLPAEVVALNGNRATAQAYEYTGALAPGDPARSLGRPLSVRLGPGLTGQVFDGLLRPLTGAGTWLEAGAGRGSASRTWTFEPRAEPGQVLEAGALLGEISDSGPVAHRVLVPPGVAGPVEHLRGAGSCGEDDPIATVGGADVPLFAWWPVRRARPCRDRLEAAAPLVTGQRVLDALYPVALGSTAAVPGGFGTGKTVLLQQIAKWCRADVIVYVGCGERGNELADVISEFADLSDPRTGGRLTDRTVIIANTSNMPIMAREASIYAGATVAEYYRDMGHDVVVIADSTSRWAEALREFASRTGALPAEEGYPAGLGSALAAFYERAGQVTTLGGWRGSVTIVGAVSPPGGDMTEPVTAHTQRFVRTLWTLDRDLAYARHYPAVGWTGSYCRDVDPVAAWYAANGDPGWAPRRARVIALLAEADRLSALADLIGVTALPGHERMTLVGGRLLREAVLQQNALSTVDAFSAPEHSAALADAVLAVIDRAQELTATGVPAQAIEEVDFAPLVRARESASVDDGAAAVRAAMETLA
jgi:V/A-type H+-transporting ATPase subunit A